MASDLKSSKPQDKAPSASGKDGKQPKLADKQASKPEASLEKAQDDADKAAADANKPAEAGDTQAEADKAKGDGDELRPGALTAASAGAPGLLPGQQVNPERAPHNAPLTTSKDGDVVVSTVNESGATDGPLKREVKLQREPLTGVNPVTGQPHAGQAPKLRDASMGAFEGDQPNRSSDQLADPSKLDDLGGQSGFDATKDLADKVKAWLDDASDKLGNLKTSAQSFLDAYNGLFQGSAQSSAPSQSTPSTPSQPAPSAPSQPAAPSSGSTDTTSSK